MTRIFDSVVTAEVAARVNALTAETTPQWGKMRVDQMLAHCNVAYDVRDQWPARVRTGEVPVA